MQDEDMREPDREGATSEGGEGGGERRGSSGWTRGLGVLSAFKDALEETIAEARDRGEVSSERAREILGRAADRAREATSDARERFDFVGRAEFDELARRVAELEDRIRAAGSPEAPGGGAGDGEGGPGG